MNRRRFLSLLVRGAAAVHCAPLLRFIPLPEAVKDDLLDEMNAVCYASIAPDILDNYFKSTSLIESLRSRHAMPLEGGQNQRTLEYHPYAEEMEGDE